MHKVFENVDTRSVPEIVSAIKEYGGYFRRFRGGALEPWAQTGWDLHEHTEMNLTLEAYATLAFLRVNTTHIITRMVFNGPQTDLDMAKNVPEAADCGATASVAIIHSLDMPESPFYSADWLSITVAHCGYVRTSGVDIPSLTFALQRHSRPPM